MIIGHTTRMRWGNDTVEIPPLRSSENGWYYDFSGKSVGRGYKGRDIAINLVNQRRLRILAKHDFRLPDEVYPKYTRPGNYNYTKGLLTWFDHPSIGHVQVHYHPEQKKLTLDTHPLLFEVYSQTNQVRNVNHGTSIEDDPVKVAADLWGYARRSFDILTLIETPETLTTYNEANKEYHLGDEVYTWARDNASFYQTMPREALETLSSERISALVDMFKVLGHKEIRVHTAHTADWKQVISDVEVRVNDPEHEEHHTVKIGAHGNVTIECGYRTDERKYLEYQKRHLSGWMQDELAEFEEMTFDN